MSKYSTQIPLQNSNITFSEGYTIYIFLLFSKNFKVNFRYDFDWKFKFSSIRRVLLNST